MLLSYLGCSVGTSKHRPIKKLGQLDHSKLSNTPLPKDLPTSSSLKRASPRQTPAPICQIYLRLPTNFLFTSTSLHCPQSWIINVFPSRVLPTHPWLNPPKVVLRLYLQIMCENTTDLHITGCTTTNCFFGEIYLCSFFKHPCNQSMTWLCRIVSEHFSSLVHHYW